jgi:hypothetical protein
MFYIAEAALTYGKTPSVIARETKVPRTTINDFLSRKSKCYDGFWGIWDAADEVVESTGTPKHELKILIYDIETSPILGYFWGLFQQNISINMIKNDWFVMTWAAKWLGEQEVMHDSCWNHGFDPNNTSECDRPVINSLWRLIDEADMIVAHNGNRFDIKKVTARAITLGIKPHKPVKKIDTMLIAKSVAAFTSNKLDWLAQVLCGEQKIDTGGFSLWARCLEGDEAAWHLMQEYNINDVIILENVFVALAPYDTKAPSFITHVESEYTRCVSPVCGSERVVETGSTVKTNTSEFVGYECLDCGKQMRGRKNVRSKLQMASTLMNPT